MMATVFRKRTHLVVAALLIAAISATAADGAPIYVSPEGNDANEGTEADPLATIPAALETAEEGATIMLASGEYDLDGFTTALDRPLTIEGAGADATVITNPGTISFTDSLTVRGVTFLGGQGIVLKPDSPEGATLDGVLIEDCAFQDCRVAISTHKDPRGVITNFTVRSCSFSEVRSGIVILYGLISNVRILKNTFTDIGSLDSGASCVVVGSNATRETTRDVVVADNLMDGIVGDPGETDGTGHEVHGVLAYGTNIAIVGNTVRNLNPARDHEAIYMKARHSVIANNIIEDCGGGGGGGDISAKGGEGSWGNVIAGNRVTGDGPGRGIFAAGGHTIVGNHVHKPNGFNGIDVYALGHPATITGNFVETREGSGIRVDGGQTEDEADLPQIVISGNTSISYEGVPMKVENTLRKLIVDNETRQGPQ